MPRGRSTAVKIVLTPTQDRTLRRMLTQWSLPSGVMRRARLVLLVAAGHTITDAAAWVGLSRRHTYKWLLRWQTKGLAGLQEEPRGYRAHRVRWPIP